MLFISSFLNFNLIFHFYCIIDHHLNIPPAPLFTLASSVIMIMNPKLRYRS